MNPPSRSLQRICLVDDDPDIRMVIELTLKLLGGFEVEVCSNGQEALRRAGTFAPDLILLDVMMPDMDGPATMAGLRGLPPLAEVPMVFMTAKAQPSEAAHLESLGAAGVVFKPFDPASLPGQLREIWARTQSHRQD